MPSPIPVLSSDELLKRAIASCRSIYIRKRDRERRWVAVKSCLSVTENQARALCEWAGLDADELVWR